ncbi:phage tail sheath protein FI [Paenibacillus mucilaginosus]|uniref:phage tail sheath family protein n=1 Tax=Paenibacillus mucilaginosus TaxID=61624 RepID=UPI003D1950B8
MPEYLSPGVYVEEFDSGGVPMQGVSTSTAGFIGMAERGPVSGLPQLVTSFADFTRQYGGYLPDKVYGQARYLAYAVEQFFNNGGGRCYVMRVAPENALPARSVLAYQAGVSEEESDGAEENTPEIVVRAKNPGSWGNGMSLSLSPSFRGKKTITELEDGGAAGSSSSVRCRVEKLEGYRAGDTVAITYTDRDASGNKRKSFHRVDAAAEDILTLTPPVTGKLRDAVVEICELTVTAGFGGVVEVFENVSLNDTSTSYIENALSGSRLIQLESARLEEMSERVYSPYRSLTGQDEGYSSDLKPPVRYFSFQDGDDGSVDKLNIPADIYIGTDEGPGNRSGIKAFVDNDEVSILSVPGITEPAVQKALVDHCENLGSRFAVLDIPLDFKKAEELLAHRNHFDSSYAAVYHPWVQVYDALEKRNAFMPPSGSVAGVYARSDTTRGVHKAPANEVVRGALGLSCQYNAQEQAILNPRGVNLIRAFTGQGIRIWGARTCSSNGLWKYVNVRRLFIFLEESIRAGTNWVVFEPNDQALWSRVNLTIDSFLTTVWRSGALTGGSPSEAFYVQIGRNTMTQDDIDNGRLICVIGVAAVKPAEFVIFRLTQKTGGEAAG